MIDLPCVKRLPKAATEVRGPLTRGRWWETDRYRAHNRVGEFNSRKKYNPEVPKDPE